MVQQSPKGTPSRRTPTARGAGPKQNKQSWVKCQGCGLMTMTNHECDTVGPCIGESAVKLTSVYKDTVYCHLHPDTMKEIGIKIGAYARINSDVLECWPDSTMLLNHVGYLTQDRTLVTVEVIENIRNAQQVSVTIEGKIEKTYLPFVLQNKVIFSSQKISVPYFNKNVSVVINSISSSADESAGSSCSNGIDSLAKEFSQTTIAENYYRVLPTTIFVEKASPVELPKLIGADELKQKICEILEHSLGGSDNFGIMGPPQTLLVSGPTGAGKTLLCKTVLQSLDYPSCCIHDFSKSVSCEDHVKVVLLDGLDRVRDDDTDKLERLSNFLLSLQNGVFALATSTVLPRTLNKFFPIQLEMPAVTSDTRFEIFEAYIKNIKSSTSTTISTGDILTISSKAHGYVGADICNVCRQALLLAKDGSLTLNHLLTALTKVPPRSMNEIKLEVPEVRWSDIGGLKGVQELLTRVISWPIIYEEKYRNMGISPPKGVLMYGPPGCCKTMMAKALATESGLNFLSVKGPELLSMYVGESERAIRDLFSRARTAAPAIVFFDEIDALATHRGSEKGSGVHDRVLAQLLTELDGVEGLTGVVVIAATNRPDRIDKALLRPGRLEKLVYIPLPDIECRKEIFKLKFRKIPHDNLDFDKCAQLTEGFSGAEVVAVSHNAAIESINSDIVTFEIMTDAIESIVPQTSTDSLDFYVAFSKNKL